MNAKSKWLTEKDGNIIIPKTLDSQTFDSDGNSLAERLRGIDDSEVIQLPKVDPTLIVSDLNYSTEEQLTGKRWTDGKPIYQKTFEGITQTISDIEELVSLTSFGFRDSGDRDVIPMPYGGGVRWVLTNDVFNLINASGLNYSKIVTTVQYTKTTDTADSPVDIPVVDKLPFKLGIDENGNYGYIKVGADTVTPFKSLSDKYESITLIFETENINQNIATIDLSTTFTIEEQ